jgi:transposase
MKYVGIDFHKNYSFITEMDEAGTIGYQTKLSNDYDTLKSYLTDLRPHTKIAIEATCNWYYFYELIEDHDVDVVLAHPLKTKAIASARLMNDKVSSETLAHLLRADLLPAAYIPDQKTRDIREVLRLRAFLTILRTRVKNRVHAILLKNGIPCPYSNIFGKRSLVWLKQLALRPCYQNAITSCTRLAKTLNEELDGLNETIEALAYDHPYAQILETHPGIAHYSGLLIATEIGDITRFPNAGKLCSYAGLVPSMHASGGWARLPNKVLNGCAGSSSKPRPMQSKSQTITRNYITASLINTAKQVPGLRSPAASAGQSMRCLNLIDHIKKDNSGQRLGVITTRKVLGSDCATGVR